MSFVKVDVFPVSQHVRRLSFSLFHFSLRRLRPSMILYKPPETNGEASNVNETENQITLIWKIAGRCSLISRSIYANPP